MFIYLFIFHFHMLPVHRNYGLIDSQIICKNMNTDNLNRQDINLRKQSKRGSVFKLNDGSSFSLFQIVGT